VTTRTSPAILAWLVEGPDWPLLEHFLTAYARAVHEQQPEVPVDIVFSAPFTWLPQRALTDCETWDRIVAVIEAAADWPQPTLPPPGTPGPRFGFGTVSGRATAARRQDPGT
jgi:hypothetical protein